jgi:hypothetical protein
MRIRELAPFFALGLIAVSTPAIAQDDAAPAAPANTPKEPVAAAPAAAAPSTAKFGNAGCGLGSMLFSPGNGFTQVFAATTNGSSGTQTFGISSGSSNCDGAGYQPGSTAAFIQSNRAALAKDMARGNGPTVAGLTELAGCTDSQAVGRSLQKNFQSIFPAAQLGDEQVSTNVINALRSDASLSCKHLG